MTNPADASVALPSAGQDQPWTTVTGRAKPVSGVHDLYVVFKGETNIGNLNWFQFK